MWIQEMLHLLQTHHSSPTEGRIGWSMALVGAPTMHRSAPCSTIPCTMPTMHRSSFCKEMPSSLSMEESWFLHPPSLRSLSQVHLRHLCRVKFTAQLRYEIWFEIIWECGSSQLRCEIWFEIWYGIWHGIFVINGGKLLFSPTTIFLRCIWECGSSQL